MPLSDFYSYRIKQDNREVFHTSCKTCHNEHSTIRARIFKINCLDYKGNKCEVCGYDKCTGALDFHHLDESKKEFAINRRSKSTLDDDIRSELDKCQVLCANCHREVHYKSIETTEFLKRVLLAEETKKAKILNKKNKCNNCNKVCSKPSKLCWSCHKATIKSKVENQPTKNELKSLLEERSFVSIGKLYGVSDNTIRKWAKKFNLI